MVLVSGLILMVIYTEVNLKPVLKEEAGPIRLKMVNNIPAVLKEISNTEWALTIIIMVKFLKVSSKTTNAMERDMLFFGMIPLSQVLGWETNLLKKID